MSRDIYITVSTVGDVVPLDQRKAFSDFISKKLKAAASNGKSAFTIPRDWIIESAYHTNIALTGLQFRYERKFDDANSVLLHKFIFSKRDDPKVIEFGKNVKLNPDDEIFVEAKVDGDLNTALRKKLLYHIEEMIANKKRDRSIFDHESAEKYVKQLGVPFDYQFIYNREIERISKKRANVIHHITVRRK